MSLVIPILMELRHEAMGTRKAIERVPASEYAWKPHAKSMSMAELITHLAYIPFYATAIVGSDGYTINPAEKAPVVKTPEEALALFDDKLATATSALDGKSDEHMMQPWTLRVGDHVVFTLPRVVVMRSMVLNHSVHHRGQLTVYLRLREIPVPSIYGPSADEVTG